ncbi:MAG: prolyl oligopeptidase family serine peptidase [Anaerolineales bacterium]|nr:prolyl oligopeptidase family serine peptidase [Anaerolineales bacterium]
MDFEKGQHAYNCNMECGWTNFLLYLPDAYFKEDKIFPLMIFLHGNSKRGDSLGDLDLLKTDGPPFEVRKSSDYPFIVISPQCPSDSFWDLETMRVSGMLDWALEHLRVDPDRVILTGLSMGAFGVWRMIFEEAGRIAAAVPVGGGWEYDDERVPGDYAVIKGLPIWTFHGVQDEDVPVWQSDILVDSMKKAGVNITYTRYEDAGHQEAWQRAYKDPKLLDWMLAQKRS